MIYFIKLSIFFASNVGFWELIRRNSKIDKYFLPSLTIAIQVTVLFVAGLFNLLEEVTYLLYGIGLCGFIYWLYKDRDLIKNYFDVGFVFLGIMLVIMLFFVKDKVFSHYDNFSHWALVVRRMLQVNRYPNFEDTIIMFQEYPLGSATYIYYFAKLTSGSESAQMLAQIYMMLASIVPLFSFCKKNKIITAIALMSATNFFFTYNISVTDLLVDTLLPLVAMCGLLYVWRYGTGVNGKFEFFAVIFYLVQLVQIKNSGLFFVAIICIWLLFNVQNDKKFLRRGICISAPFISLLLWQKHCKYVFVEAETSKHAMTVENFSSVFGAKSLEDIRTICVSVLKFATTCKEIWLTFSIVFLIGILVFIFAKNEKNLYMKISLFSIVMYVVYQIGTLGMYLFSMPLNEALTLDGNMRYMKTILIAILYLSMVPAVKLISELEEKKVLRTVSVGSIVIMNFFSHLYFSFGEIRTAIQYREDPSLRNWIEETRIIYNVPENESYMILTMDNNSGYAYFLERYIFQTNSVGAVSVKSESDLNDIRFKYIFVYDEENEMIKEWIQSNYPEQYGNRVIVQEKISYE